MHIEKLSITTSGQTGAIIQCSGIVAIGAAAAGVYGRIAAFVFQAFLIVWGTQVKRFDSQVEQISGYEFHTVRVVVFNYAALRNVDFAGTCHLVSGIV